MSRLPQNVGAKGSQKWLQYSVENCPEFLQPKGMAKLQWLSPLESDEYSEYQDGSCLKKLGLSHLQNALHEFWPRRGAVWDGLATAGDAVILVEAKAHIPEFFSPATGAKSPDSISKIQSALLETSETLHARPRADWSQAYFQYANRLAFLHFLRREGVNAHLLFVDFIEDYEMKGPSSSEAWKAAFASADYILGLSKSHKYNKFIHHVYPSVIKIKNKTMDETEYLMSSAANREKLLSAIKDLKS